MQQREVANETSTLFLRSEWREKGESLKQLMQRPLGLFLARNIGVTAVSSAIVPSVARSGPVLVVSSISHINQTFFLRF